jgi:hypothetical protein
MNIKCVNEEATLTLPFRLMLPHGSCSYSIYLLASSDGLPFSVARGSHRAGTMLSFESTITVSC